MKIKICSATIICPQSNFHHQKMDILIKDGIILKIETAINDEADLTISSKNLHVSLGWIDLHVQFQDPGFEYKETVISGLKAAAAGGFTAVGVSPITNPVRDSGSQIEYLLNQAKGNLVNVLPYGCLSYRAEGNELAELNDMRSAGAYAYTDGKRSIQNPNLILRALQYCKAFNGLVMNFPSDIHLTSSGVMNEGATSTELGLKGIPELAESIMVARDISLCEYAEGKIHFSTISSKKTIELINDGKKRGLDISCDISSTQLLLDDTNLGEFDTRFKVNPPLRNKETIKALVRAVNDGIIDAISSDHLPEDIEHKKREFDHASFGIINLQTAFSVAYTALHKDCSIDTIIKCFTDGPARILNLKQGNIANGEQANLSLFDPELRFNFSKEQVLSKSKNSPYFDMPLKGKVIGCINNGFAYLS